MREDISTDRLKGQWAFVSGATAGIGRATALWLGRRGVNLVVNGRRADRLQELKQELSGEVGIETLAFDVSKREQCERAFEENEKILSRVSILINNAGLARGVDPMQNASLDDWDEMIDVNVKGLLYLTRLFLPSFEKKTWAHIVNVGSVAGRGVYPGGGVYCASKFAVRALTEGLRMDLLGKNIRVSNISPGMVESEFSLARLQDERKAKAVYRGMTPLRPEDIADCIGWCLARPAHVNIQEMMVYPVDQGSMYHVHRRETEKK